MRFGAEGKYSDLSKPELPQFGSLYIRYITCLMSSAQATCKLYACAHVHVTMLQHRVLTDQGSWEACQVPELLFQLWAWCANVI